MNIEWWLAYYEKSFEKGSQLVMDQDTELYRKFLEVELRYRAIKHLWKFCTNLKTEFLSGTAMETKVYNEVFMAIEEMFADDNLQKRIAEKKVPYSYFEQCAEAIGNFKECIKNKNCDNLQKYSYFLTAAQELIKMWLQIREDFYLSVYRKKDVA